MIVCYKRTLQILTLITCVQIKLTSSILYPRESETREWKSLDGIWNFVISSDIGCEKSMQDRISFINAIPMPVPSSYNDITQNKTIRDQVGTAWYERTFFISAKWNDSSTRIWLRFGGVNYLASVWINGKFVMSHDMAHLPFEGDITDHLLFKKPNKVIVCVDNRLDDYTIPQGLVIESSSNLGKVLEQYYSFDFFNYAGIHRPVVLHTTPKIFIEDISVKTSSIRITKAVIKYNVEIANKVSKTTLFCQVRLFDKTGTNFVSEQNHCHGTMSVPGPQLWWPYLMSEDPGYLYTFEVSLLDSQNGDQVIDVYRLPIGIRILEWTNHSLLINNKPVYLRGFGRHEDSNIRGKGLDWTLITKDYNLIKWTGANAYRTSHYPYAEEVMDFADEQGIMIIDESASVDTRYFSNKLLNNHKRALKELIERDKNRPSVIAWSVANEPTVHTVQASTYFNKIVNYVKFLDETRPVTAAIARIGEELVIWDIKEIASLVHTYPYFPRSNEELCRDMYKSCLCTKGHTMVYYCNQKGQYLDIISLNRYNAWYTNGGRIDMIVGNLVENLNHVYNKYRKPIILSEYGGDAIIGLHLNPSFQWSAEYQIELMSHHFIAFDLLRNKGFFIGEFIWNFADFQTAQGYTRVGGNRKGIFTRERQPKLSAYHLRKRYMILANLLDNATLPNDLFYYVAPNFHHKEYDST